MLKVGIFGVGRWGEIHARILDQLASGYLIIGFFERDDALAARMEKETGLFRFTDADLLINACDCIDITSPAAGQFEIAARSIKKSKHVFLEKNVLRSAEEAKKLMRLAAEASVHGQVGYAERFNPAFLAARDVIEYPRFIDINRLATVSGSDAESSVVKDLMLHDIDLVLSLVRSGVKRVSANGVCVLHASPDIVNARIEFNNGCVANFTASRIATAEQRTIQLFQREAAIKIDLLEQEAEIMLQKTLVLPSGMVVLDSDKATQLESLAIEKLEITQTDPVAEQLRSFAQVIHSGGVPVVSIEDAFRSMELSAQITDRLKIARIGNNDNI